MPPDVAQLGEVLPSDQHHRAADLRDALRHADFKFCCRLNSSALPESKGGRLSVVNKADLLACFPAQRSTEAGSASQASLPETSAASARPSPAVTLLPSGACAHLPVPTAAQPAEQQPNVAAAHQLILQRISLARKWSRAQFRNNSNNNSKEVNVSSCSECHMPAARPRLCLACGTCLCASDLCHRAHCKRVVAAAQNNSIGLHHLAYDPAATVVSCAQCRDVAAFVSFPSASSASSSGSGSTSSASSSHSSSPPSMISSSSSGSAAAAPTPAWPTKPRGILNLGNTW